MSDLSLFNPQISKIMEPTKIYLEDGQPREKVGTAKGTATYYKNGDVDFKAYAQGEPQRKDVTKKGQSSCYRTIGKEPKRVAHLVIDDNAPDKAAALQEELDKFLTGFGGKQKEAAPRRKDRMLWDADGIRVWMKPETKNVLVTLDLPLNLAEDMKNDVLSKLQKVYQCFTINRQYLRRAVLAQKKTSSE